MRHLLTVLVVAVFLCGTWKIAHTETGSLLQSVAIDHTVDQDLWTSPGSPADTGFNGDVFSLGIYDGDLIVGGVFTTAAGLSALKIAGWNGSSWFDMNNIPAGNTVYDLLEFNGKLYHGYSIASHVSEWDGSSWTQLMPQLVVGFSHPVWAVEAYDNKVVAGGDWVSDNGQPSYIAAWNGTGWDSLGTGITDDVRDLKAYDGLLIAGGYFTVDDGAASDRIAAWNGSTWSSLNGGMPDGGVWVMTVYNGDLIAGGTFTEAGGVSVTNIARWDGTNWYPLGSGLDGIVRALTVHNGNLIAGGFFENSGSTSVPYIASWDGSTWSPLGNAMDDGVEALTVYNGYLIAGGRFDVAGGGKVALWDGAIWRPVGDFVTDVDEGGVPGLPLSYALGQNYPNPFNPVTTIGYTLPQRSHVTIDVYNLLGRQVRTLVDREVAAGSFTVSWDGTNADGKQVSTGVYLYRFRAGDHVETKKMVLMK
ncbi:T9SS type A sorting domain-containing protein [candidate division GN15 bacterium]|nr:T9SS type A sorting domain-containing protein [candidate division GN15 bacterium]